LLGKQSILVAIQRQGPVFPIPVDTVKNDTISPINDAVADPSADLMTDKSFVSQQTGSSLLLIKAFIIWPKSMLEVMPTSIQPNLLMPCLKE
jgi:hypothetical protein